MEKLTKLYMKMVEWDKGHPDLIQHFAKVHDFAEMIAVSEGVDEETLFIIQVSALVHDIGILPAIRLYGDSNGKNQEKVSEPYVREMLSELEFDEKIIDRVSYIVTHHHTYDHIDGLDYRIIVEADFLVNLYEHNHYKGEPMEVILKAYHHIFKTECGKRLLESMYLNGEKDE